MSRWSYRTTSREDGASLLMVLFAIVFVSGIISVLITIIDGGTRQSASLNQTQSQRLAGASALQAAEAVVANTVYTSPSSVPCLNGGSISYTDPNGLSFQTTCTLLSAPGSGSFSDGSFVNSTAQIGADAVVLTGKPSSLNMSGKGSLNLGGNMRAAGNLDIYGSGSAPGGNGACPWPYVVAPQTNCGQVALDPGMAWAAGTCAGSGVTNNPPGLFPLLDVNASVASQPYCSGLANTSSAMTTAFGSQIAAILNQEASQLPTLNVSAVANFSGPLPGASPECATDSKGNGVLYLHPGYYTDGAQLSLYTGWDTSTNKASQYYVNATGLNQTGLCVSTGSSSTTPVMTVVLLPSSSTPPYGANPAPANGTSGQYFLNLNQPWVVANQITLVGGTPVFVAKGAAPGGTVDHYTCEPPYDLLGNGAYKQNAGVELVFGSTTGGANVNGIIAGNGSNSGNGQPQNRGSVTLCGTYDGTHVPAVIYGTTSTLSLSNAGVSVGTLTAHASTSPCNLATLNGSTPCAALLSNSQFGSFNLYGTVFAPRDSLNLELNPICLTKQLPVPHLNGEYLSGQFLDCELDYDTTNYPQRVGQVSIYGGVVLSGFQTNNSNTLTTGAKIALGTAGWLPAAQVPTGAGGGGLDLGFTACSPSVTACSYLARSEAEYDTPTVSGSSITSWTRVRVHEWLN